MKWSSRPYVPPKEGELRDRHAFLFLPKTIGAETRWLEWATWTERWTRDPMPVGILSGDYWAPIRWTNE